MKNRVVDAICLLLRLCGVPFFVRLTIAKNRVTILNYHDPEPDIFEAHLTYYSRHYNFIHIDKLHEVMREGNFATLPPRSMIITLDDGHKGNAKLLPIVRKLGVPVVIYAVAGLVGTPRHFWFKAEGVPQKELKKLKMCSDITRKQILEKDYNYRDEILYSNGHGLEVKDLVEFIKMGAVVGSHTVTHPILPRCETQVAITEIEQAKDQLEDILEYEVKHFAYPVGAWSVGIRQKVVDAGYLSARTIRPGLVSFDSDLYSLPCFGVSDTASLNKAILQSCGFWTVMKCLKPGVRRALNGLSRDLA